MTTKKDLFSEISLDLKIEILTKLPAKSISKFVLVSKMWSSIIRSKDFMNLYMARSLTRPRHLFHVYYSHNTHGFFYSCSKEVPSYDHHQRVTFTSDGYFSPPIRGLICCRNGHNLLVGNPSTGQYVTLPSPTLPSPSVSNVELNQLITFFGYDPVNDLYKVLCMTVKYGTVAPWESENHQVLTLGAQEPWRKIQCKHNHFPIFGTNNELPFMNGFVYYSALINKKTSLISFDVSSEDFNVIELPEDVQRDISIRDLVNYSGKIALTNNRAHTGIFNVWVLRDASKQEWSKVSVVVPSWSDLVGGDWLWFEGALSTGELIFSPTFPSPKPYYLIYYDVKEKQARKVFIEGIINISNIRVFLDHVPSPMFLSSAS